MKLYRKIMILINVVVLISILIFLPFVASSIRNNIQYEHENNIQNIGTVIASSPFIREALENKDPDGKIASYVGSLYHQINEVEFIVIADMDSIRYSHPNVGRIGERFVGGDEERVIRTGESYISKGVGTLGESLRYFKPIYNLSKTKQIGFVSVGSLTESISKAKLEAQSNLIIVTFFAIFIGSLGAAILTKNIKKSLLGLEPDEISKLYNEKVGMLQGLHEGIIAIDKNSHINMINRSALRILYNTDELDEKDIIGKPIQEIFKNTKLPEVISTGQSEFNQEVIINDTVIIANRIPIKNKNDIIGAIVTFRDRTEITRLAEEVTGVNLIVDTLRANTHEFMNKLHVVLGLMQMGELEEAESYIIKTADEQEFLSQKIIKRIKDTTIAALLMGKVSRSKELGIDFIIDDESQLEESKSRKITTHTLVTIIGNLLENAFEAVNISKNDLREVYLKIIETDIAITITVRDTGIGITKEHQERIFERGYTTKTGSKGIGLDTIQKIITILNGDIICESEINEGTYMTIIIPKKISEVEL